MSIRKNIDTWLRKFEKEFTTHNRIDVSKSAILHNFDLFTALTDKQIIPVLKGNAYGHGIKLVTRALKSRKFPYIAVDGYFEALRVRGVSSQPVLIMGAIRPENFARLKYDNFAFVVQDEVTVRALGKTGKSINVHLECNTGMNRYGAKARDVTKLTELIRSYKNLTLQGIMSHLADSDGEDAATVELAMTQFDRCVELVRAAGADPAMVHIAQTAGSVRAESKYANTIRVGIGLYGINPFPAGHVSNQKLRALRPALTFASTITKVIELQKGDNVSYGYTFTAPHKMKIGVLPAGYYEGINRALSNTGVVKVGATFTPIVGRVCMNHTMISLDGVRASMGDEVIIYSNNPQDKNTIDRLAHEHSLFNYNMLTALSPDVRRVLVE